MKPNVVARLNRMVKIIREKRAVPFGELCLMMNMSPATMYGYIRLMKNVFVDIHYENGIFECTSLDPVEKATEQRKIAE